MKRVRLSLFAFTLFPAGFVLAGDAPPAGPPSLAPARIYFKPAAGETKDDRRWIEGYGNRERPVEVEREGITLKDPYISVPDTEENKRRGGIRIFYMNRMPGELFLPYDQVDEVVWGDVLDKEGYDALMGALREHQKRAAAAEAERRKRVAEEEAARAKAEAAAAALEAAAPKPPDGEGELAAPKIPESPEFEILRKYPPDEGWGAVMWEEIQRKWVRGAPTLTMDERIFREKFQTDWVPANRKWQAILEEYNRKRAEADAKKKEAETAKPPEGGDAGKPPEPKGP